MERLKWQDRYAVTLDPHRMRQFSNEQSAWYESDQDVAAGLKEGQEKARLLRWVRKHMARRLTKVERRCIELYFFHGLTYRDAAVLTQTNPSTVFRAVRRGLRKLKQGVEEDRLEQRRSRRSSTGSHAVTRRVSPRQKRDKGPG